MQEAVQQPWLGEDGRDRGNAISRLGLSDGRDDSCLAVHRECLTIEILDQLPYRGSDPIDQFEVSGLHRVGEFEAVGGGKQSRGRPGDSWLPILDPGPGGGRHFDSRTQ